MFLKPLLLIASTAISLVASASGYSNALLDFNMNLKIKGESRAAFHNMILTQVCSRSAANALTFAKSGKEIATVKASYLQNVHSEGREEFTLVYVPAFQGCALISKKNILMPESEYASALDLSIIDLFKAAIENKISPNDAVLLVSTLSVSPWNGSVTIIQDDIVEPLNLAVVTAEQPKSKFINLTSIKSDTPTQLQIVTTLQDSTLEAYKKLNTPSLLHRDSVMRKILGLQPTSALKISDFLEFEVIYFATKNSNEKDWKSLIETTQADLELQNGASAEIQNIQNSIKFKKVATLTLIQRLDLYVSIYRDNMNDVIAINDASAPPVVTNSDQGSSSAQEQYYRFALQRQKEIDFVNAIGGALELGAAGTSEGKRLLDQTLR